MATLKIYVLINYGKNEDGCYSNVKCFTSKEECKERFNKQVKDLECDITTWYPDVSTRQLHEIGVGKDITEDRFGYVISECAVEWEEWGESSAEAIIRWEETEIRDSGDSTKPVWEI